MNNKRWLFVLSGNVEISHIYNDNGDLVGMVLETDTEIVECYSPDDVNGAIDRWITMTQYTGSIH